MWIDTAYQFAKEYHLIAVGFGTLAVVALYIMLFKKSWER